MKKIFNFMLVSFVVAGFAFMNTSCSTDPCDDVVCQNGGIPTELGDECYCDCPSGFTGDRCQTDICEGVECQNDGTPTLTATGLECECSCVNGYEGESCEVKWTTKFLGTYNGNDDCGFTYESTITEDDFNVIRISNAGGFNISITATLTSSTEFNIPNQTDASGRVWSGNGSISNSTITLNYVVTFSDGTSDSCTVTYTK